MSNFIKEFRESQTDAFKRFLIASWGEFCFLLGD